MAEVVLFHHVLGLTEGIERLAEEMRHHGHAVTAPDLFEGKVFSSLEEGMAHVRTLGFEEVAARGVRAAEALSPAAVYMGYSLGGIPAQKLAQSRPGARGAVLVAACLPPEELGGPWPRGVPLQIHAEEHDPEFDNGYDLPTARAVVAAAADAELFLYPGNKHFFADSSLPDYEPAVARLFMTNVLAFLDRL
ncbi:MAG: dienelactone hydrolase family protein [Trueperaceae bacterium]|jgi:dienelactone hydrolase|nr:dienelactone hydrolase family protein [Truepera sp.]HRN19235.1 dienelactone hydrolase family protein [Trueperaceae bacterium]HRQ10189.1 dienelactone hydrolase family protein [Trueperaceae bacterium]